MEWAFFSWLLDHSSGIGLKFFSRPWFHQLPGFAASVIGAEISYGGQQVFGLGQARTDVECYVIAAAEALERVGMLHLKLKNSNANAVHLDLARARQNAASELIERDAFLCHLYTLTAGLKLPAALAPRLLELQNTVKELGWQLEARRLHSADGRPCVLVGIHGLNLPVKQGMFLGLALGEEWHKTLESALAECLRYWDAHRANPANYPAITEAEFHSLRGKSVREHARLGLNPEFATEMWAVLFGAPATDDLAPVRRFEELEITYRELALSEVYQDCPLVFVQASSPRLATIGFGDHWQESDHPERWQQFRRGGRRWSRPHCFG